MARKRRLEVPRPPPPEDDEGPGWKDWLVRDYSRYWYWIGMGFLDVIVFFEIQRMLRADWSTALLLAAPLVLGQMWLYLRLWGENSIFNRKE